MKKTGKRLVALSIVFASIISFLPMQIGSNGKAANAMTTQIQVSGASSESGGSINIVNGEYATDNRYDSFTLSVDYQVKTLNDIAIGQKGVIEQEVIVTNIDGIELNGATLQENNDKLSVIGAKIGEGTELVTDINNNKKIGIKIEGLPYGVNIIKYRIREKQIFNKGKQDPAYPTDATKKVDDFQNLENEYYPSKTGSAEMVIQHANKFVQTKIKKMIFDSYLVKTKKEYDESTTPKDNKDPFLFTEEGVSDPNCPLRYNFSISDAVMTLKYSMTFNGLSADNATIYKNGVDDTNNISTNGNTISGFLTNLTSSDLIVARVKDDTGQNNVVKSYAIQLKYNTIASSKDYTLRDAGIKKLYYNADSTVEAYVDKNFTVTTDNNGVKIYKGTINIDKRAQMIAMVPTLGTTGNVAFKLSNHYDGGSVVSSRIINGETTPYVDFNKGQNNQLWVEVYEGKDGNVKEGTSPLAIYQLDVKTINDTETSTVNFSVDGNAYLTQPGRTSEADKIDFDSSRRTYNLNFKDSTTNNVYIDLNSPNTVTKTGVRREYIKVWGGTSTQSDNVTEIPNLDKDARVNVDVTNYKKIIVQAYYDQIVYKVKDGVETTEVESTTAYPLGEKYTFYVAKNPDQTDTTVTKSTDASLTNMKASNGSIKSTDGTSGFSTDKTNYTVTVPKIDTSSAITVTAASSKAKDITATIAETGDEYGLVSGEAFDFPLTTNGTTNINIVVTAEDGVTTKTYNLTIKNDERSASALLKNVVTDNGDFTFDADKDPNKIRVDQSINKLKVSPVPEEANSRITVNGTKYTGTPITIDLKGSQETDMEIKVTSEDGSESKTYNFEIYRTDSPIDNTDDDDEDDVFYDDIDDAWVDLSKYEEWGTVDGKSVYFDNKGRQVKDKWISTKGVLYYLNSKGYKATGWRKEVGGKSYYLDPSTGAVKTGWLNQNNKWYYLGLNGVMQKGWLSLNGHWYYFTPEGEMITSQSMYIDDGIYNFGADGVMY